MVTTGITLGPLIIDESTVTYLDYCTLADVETYTGVDFSEGIGPTEAEIGEMITNASRLVDVYAGVQIAGTVSAPEFFDSNIFLSHLVLTRRPVVSVTNIWKVGDSVTDTVLTQGRGRNTSDYFLHDGDAGIVRFMGNLDRTAKEYIKVEYISGNSTVPASAKMATIMIVARNAARAALNDENCMERVKEMWKELLRSSDADARSLIELVKNDAPVMVATFGLEGAY